MKQLSLWFSLCFFIMTASNGICQVDQGRILLGGNVSFDQESRGHKDFQNGAKTDDHEENLTYYRLRPEGGYFVQDQWAVGLGVAYSRFNRNRKGVSLKDSVPSLSKVEITRKNHSYSINPYGRYYADLGNNFYFFAELGVYFTKGESSTEYDGSKKHSQSEYTTLGANLRPGLTYFLSDRLGFYFTTPNLIGFSHSTEKKSNTDIQGETQENETTTTKLNGNFDLETLFNPTNVGIGVNVYLD